MNTEQQIKSAINNDSKIKAEIKDTDLNTTLISHKHFGHYFHVRGDITGTVTINNKEHFFVMQTDGYKCNDYSAPANDVCFYDGWTSDLIYKLSVAYQSEINQEFVNELNDDLETSYTVQQINQLYLVICDLTSEAEKLIYEKEAEAAKNLEEDSRIFVEYFVRTNDDDGYGRVQDSESQLKIFDNQEEADEFLAALTGFEAAGIINKEAAYSTFL